MSKQIERDEENDVLESVAQMLRRVSEECTGQTGISKLGHLKGEIDNLERLARAPSLVRFTGHSDDLVEVEGADEFDVGFSAGHMRSFDLLSQEGQARVHALFDGCWSFAVGLVNDGDPLPDWPIRVKNGETSYTTVLEILAPADVTVALLERRS